MPGRGAFKPDEEAQSMSPASLSGASLRIHLTYLWRHRRRAQLADPTLFTEFVQLRKLHERNPRMPALADKVTAKSLAAGILGRDWVIPILWSGTALPADLPWKGPVVAKARHGCNQNAFVRNRHDWRQARAASARWMRRDYGWWLDEWLYTQIPRGLLVEPMIGAGGDLPVDYKIFVFGGQATHVQVHVDRARRHRWVLHDRDWRALVNDAPRVPRPTALTAMLAAAEEMAMGFDFARVDFYQPGDQPLFGEVTSTPDRGCIVSTRPRSTPNGVNCGSTPERASVNPDPSNASIGRSSIGIGAPGSVTLTLIGRTDSYPSDANRPFR